MWLQDRHNGNILMDVAGHIIHIDFGFMLSNSPGGVNFEAAPFKLTRELLEIMDSNSEGHASEIFDYFKVGLLFLLLCLTYLLSTSLCLMLHGYDEAIWDCLRSLKSAWHGCGKPDC